MKVTYTGMKYFLEDTFQELGLKYHWLTLAHQYYIGHPDNDVIVSFKINGNNQHEFKIFANYKVGSNGEEHTTVTTSKDVFFVALEQVIKLYDIDKNYSPYEEV